MSDWTVAVSSAVLAPTEVLLRILIIGGLLFAIGYMLDKIVSGE